MMISSFPDYHKEFNLTRPLANAFLAMSHDALWEDIQIISDLCAVVKDRGPDISYLDWYLEQAVAEWERRRERYERYWGDTFPPAWPEWTYYEEMRAQADDLKAHVSIERYLAEQVPHIELKQSGPGSARYAPTRIIRRIPPRSSSLMMATHGALAARGAAISFASSV